MDLKQYKFIPNWNNKDVSDIKSWHLLAFKDGIDCTEHYLVYKSPALVQEYKDNIIDISMYSSLNDLFKAGYVVKYITTKKI